MKTFFDTTTSTTFTKSMLLSAPHEIYRLITTNEEFSESPLAQDFEILKTVYSGTPIAFTLARTSEPWCETQAAQEFRTLALRDNKGQTLAHILAFLSNCWPGSQAAQNPEILTLFSNSDGLVANTLVAKCREWVDTPAASDPLILSADSNGTSIGQLIVSKYHYRYESTILKLVTCGRAFKTNPDFKPNPIKDHQLAKQLLLVLQETPDPVIATKILGSIYSTFQGIYHDKEKPNLLESILNTTLPSLIQTIALPDDVVIQLFQSDTTNALFLEHFKRAKCLESFSAISTVNDPGSAEPEPSPDAPSMFY